MRVLVVDDEYEKIGRVASLLRSVVGAELELIHRSTAYDGRLAMRSAPVDMLIVDLYLPDTAGEPPSADGGIRFYRMLQLDDEVALPADTIFLTAKDDSLDQVRHTIESYGARLCRYDESSDDWQGMLSGITNNANLRLRRSKVATICDIAVITALRTPELAAVLDLNYGWQEYRLQNDPTIYHLGGVHGLQNVRVVAACAQRKGMASSAALASKMCTLFKPKYLFMLGICAGIPGKAKLGDVVIADPVWDWGSGKNAKRDDASIFQLSPYQHGLDASLAQRCSEMARNQEFSTKVRANWGAEFPEGKLEIHLGPMASGASVIADEGPVEAIVQQNRDIVALDMEAYAVMAAAEYTAFPKVKAAVIKSVCDYADPRKENRWQAYASYTSAIFFDSLVRKIDLRAG